MDGKGEVGKESKTGISGRTLRKQARQGQGALI